MEENADQNNSKYGNFSHSDGYKHDNYWQTDRYVMQLTEAAVHVLRKGCSENIQQFCRRTSMPECDARPLIDA